MTFAFFEYLINNLLFPVFAIAFAAVPAFRVVTRVIGQLVRREPVDLGDGRTWMILILLVVVLVILVNILLSSGGIHLIYERTDDAVTIQGTVSDIRALSSLESPRYMANGESSFSYEYTIGDVTCTGMALGSLEIGDEVTVTYMPKSGLVLAIEENS